MIGIGASWNATHATVMSRRSFMPRPGRSHISPKTKFRMPAPEYGLSRIGANGMQLMSLNDCSPTNSRISGSLGVISGSSGSGGGGLCPRSRWIRSHCSSTTMLNHDALGQPAYTAKCNTVSRISSMVTSPLLSAAYTWSRNGASASAAATHARVTNRRSRRLNAGRDQISPYTKSISPLRRRRIILRRREGHHIGECTACRAPPVALDLIGS